MAGVVGSTPTRPTTISLSYSDNGKLLGPLQRGCNAAAALRLSSSSKRSLRLSRHLIYRCWALVNCLEPFKNCCSVGLRKKEDVAAACLSWIRSIKSVNMSSDNEYEIRELRKEIDYLAEDVEKLKRLVKNMKDVNSLKLTADDEEYLRGID
jgi:hypothetical protein